MTEREMQLRIGALVLAAIVLFVGFVLSIGRRSALFEKRYSLWTSFISAEGLAEGAPVRLGGVPVGNVTGITFGRELKDRGIVVNLAIEQRVQDRIREDSVASIGTIGLVGDKVLDITVGSHDRPPLPPGGRVASVDPTDFSRLLQKGDQILEHVTRISASLDEFLSGKDSAAGKRSLGEAIQSIRNTLVEVEKGQGLLHDVIYGREGAELLGKVDRTVTSLEHVAQAIEKEGGFLHALIYTPQEETMGRLTRTLAGLEDMVREGREGRGLLHALIYDPEGAELIARLNRSGEQLEGLVRSVREGQGLVPSLLFDPESAKVLDDIKAAAAGIKAVTADLQVVTTRLRQGEGTLGALLEDPTVYEDLSALLRGANRSTLLRSLIRSTREDGERAKP
ncbi:MAG: MlaD family protein [Candidatus Methylomirabilota bacterium]